MNRAGDLSENEKLKKEEAEKRNQEIKADLLAQALDQDARARSNPQKAQMVESTLMNMLRSGRITSKLREDQFVQILRQISSSTQKSTTVKFDRRRAAIDSDDDDRY